MSPHLLLLTMVILTLKPPKIPALIAIDKTNIPMAKVLLQPTKPRPIMHNPGPIVPTELNNFLMAVVERRSVFRR